MLSWEYVRLSENCEVFPGFAFDSDGFTDNPEDIHLVKGENLHQNYIDWEKAKRWNQHDWQHLNKYQLRASDIVLAMDRPWVEAGLKWAYISKRSPKALLVQRVARLRSRNNLDQNFLRHVVGSKLFEGYLKMIVTGVNVPHISGKQIGDFKFYLPPLPIQRKIAAILSAYDDLIENNNRRIAILEKMAEELYREWFVRLRFPRHESTKIVKGVPEGWEVKKLGEIVDSVMGQSPSSEFYNEDGRGLPFNQGVGTYGERFPRREIYCESSGRIAEAGDILFSVRAPVGRLNIADCRMIIGRGLASLRHKTSKQSYLFYLLKVSFAREDIIGNGAIFNAVTKDELLGFPILSPNPELIERYDQQSKHIDSLVASLIRQNAIMKEARDRLLSRLMSGKIDVEKLDIQFPESMREDAGAAERPEARG